MKGREQSDGAVAIDLCGLQNEPKIIRVNCKHHLNLMIRRKIYLKNHLTINVDRITLQQYIE